MGIADDTLSAFGDSLGLEGLAFNAGGVATLELEDTGTLVFERPADAGDDGEVLVYLARPFAQHTEGLCRRALAACHPDQGHPYPVTAGLKGEEVLVFLLRVPEREFSLQIIEECIVRLSQLHDTALGA